jgi:hypothetical protein
MHVLYVSSTCCRPSCVGTTAQPICLAVYIYAVLRCTVLLGSRWFFACVACARLLESTHRCFCRGCRDGLPSPKGVEQEQLGHRCVLSLVTASRTPWRHTPAGAGTAVSSVHICLACQVQHAWSVSLHHVMCVRRHTVSCMHSIAPTLNTPSQTACAELSTLHAAGSASACKPRLCGSDIMQGCSASVTVHNTA